MKNYLLIIPVPMDSTPEQVKWIREPMANLFPNHDVIVIGGVGGGVVEIERRDP